MSNTTLKTVDKETKVINHSEEEINRAIHLGHSIEYIYDAAHDIYIPYANDGYGTYRIR